MMSNKNKQKLNFATYQQPQICLLKMFIDLPNGQNRVQLLLVFNTPLSALSSSHQYQLFISLRKSYSYFAFYTVFFFVALEEVTKTKYEKRVDFDFEKIKNFLYRKYRYYFPQISVFFFFFCFFDSFLFSFFLNLNLNKPSYKNSLIFHKLNQENENK